MTSFKIGRIHSAMEHLFLIRLVLLAYFLLPSFYSVSEAAKKTFDQDFAITWSPDHVTSLNNGQVVQLRLDNSSGSGFASKGKYMFGNISTEIKLVHGDSAGTVTAYYLSSDGPNHDELDYEFLGNVSGEPYILQTNIYTNGAGGREQRIYLWFDPTTDFHSYSVLWNQYQIIFLVDGIPIRVFTNKEGKGVEYPSSRPMGLYSSIWNGDQWATRGGLVKINWSYAPFIASYRNFEADACEGTNSGCISAASSSWWNEDQYKSLSQDQSNKLNWVQKNYLVYDYCTDRSRYPTLPAECDQQA